LLHMAQLLHMVFIIDHCNDNKLKIFSNMYKKPTEI